MKDKIVILGGGLNGMLTYAYLKSKGYTNVSVISKSNISLYNLIEIAPLFLYKNEYMESILNYLDINFESSNVNVGYIDTEDNVLSDKPKSMYKNYGELSRPGFIDMDSTVIGTVVDSKAYSTVKNNNCCFYFNKATEIVFNKIFRICKDNYDLVDATISEINLESSYITVFNTFGERVYNYDQLISTIPYNNFNNLCNRRDLKVKLGSKLFLLNYSDNSEIYKELDMYAYIYNSDFKYLFNRYSKFQKHSSLEISNFMNITNYIGNDARIYEICLALSQGLQINNVDEEYLCIKIMDKLSNFKITDSLHLYRSRIVYNCQLLSKGSPIEMPNVSYVGRFATTNYKELSTDITKHNILK